MFLCMTSTNSTLFNYIDHESIGHWFSMSVERFISYYFYQTLPWIPGHGYSENDSIRIPGAPLTNFNDGGGRGFRRGSYFVPKKITTSELIFVYPKKSLLFSAYPKKSLSPFFTTQKSLFFFVTPKKSRRLSDPKKLLLPKISDPKKSLRPPPPPFIKICEWGH